LGIIKINWVEKIVQGGRSLSGGKIAKINHVDIWNFSNQEVGIE
jgi:hypothetical protein